MSSSQGPDLEKTIQGLGITREMIEAFRSFKALGDVSSLPPMARDLLRAFGIEPPAELAERHAREIRELGLEVNVKDLEERGYTIVRDAFDDEMASRLRTRLLEVAAEDRERGIVTMQGPKGPTGQAVFRLLERGRVFEEAAVHPVLVALMTHVLGWGYTASTFTGMVRPRGTPELPLHSDNQFMPAPFPAWQQVATAVWCTEDFSREAGSTRIVPGSHERLRHPRPGEGEDEAIAIEAPKGSLLVWVGNTWHGNCARQLEGERVTLHTAFCRLHVRPLESYDSLPQEVIDRNPPVFADIVGRRLPFGYDERGPQTLDLLRVQLMSHAAHPAT
jgi:ectoine hydroxylase-related dioxygenase (phytanoyl-CoA dioxygenase family)